MGVDAMAVAFAEAEAHPDVYRDAALPPRDPRADPHPGDVLAVRNDVRVVLVQVGGCVQYGFPYRVATRWLTLGQWRQWAKGAQVRQARP